MTLQTADPTPDLDLDQDTPTPVDTSDLSTDLLSGASLTDYSADYDHLNSFLSTPAAPGEPSAGTPKTGESKPLISEDEATKYAMLGIEQITFMASQYVGRNVMLPEQAAGMVAGLFIPAIQKYGHHIKDYFNQKGKVDLNSRTPELMAGAGAAGLLGWMWYQSQNGELIDQGESQEPDQDNNPDDGQGGE